ncbi:Membrane protein involved in the export of O-antigen and teichoic acid [bacterium A37T11]|nr:Membrane protein involved in the export of O-antigen and teichoic acid [bacterium A37T11]
MNLIKKQGIYNSIWLYLGTALGFVNLIIIFQRSLTIEQIGFYNLLIALVALFNQFASLGISNVITRYLPVFRTPDHKHHGFATYVFLLCGVSFGLFSALFYVFREQVIAFKGGKAATASLLSNYYPYILPIAGCALLFLIQETFARTIFKTIFPSFLREIVLRLSATVGALLVLGGWVGYGGFINIYLFTNILLVMIISGYVYSIKAYSIAPMDYKIQENLKPMLYFGFYSTLSGGSFSLLQNLDVILLKFFSGEAMVGVYSTFFAIAQVITLPAKALNITSYQIIANAWKENELEKINRIYGKTTIIQCLVGSLLLTGMIINRENLLNLLHKPEYRDHFNVLIVVGLTFLIDATGGINQAIVGFSKHYRLVMVVMIAASIVCFLLNIWLIPTFNLLGAAFSYLITISLTNFTFWLYLKLNYHMQPFSGKILLIFLTAGICIGVGIVIPPFANLVFDIIFRSGIVMILYALISYMLGVSPEFNEIIDKYLPRRK